MGKEDSLTYHGLPYHLGHCFREISGHQETSLSKVPHFCLEMLYKTVGNQTEGDRQLTAAGHGARTN
jgi:hypothetical protein